jgi:hypothetical protein
MRVWIIIGGCIGTFVFCATLWMLLGVPATVTLTAVLVVVAMAFLPNIIGRWAILVSAVLIIALILLTVNWGFERTLPISNQMRPYAILGVDLKLASWLNSGPTKAEQELLVLHQKHLDRTTDLIKSKYQDGNPWEAIQIVEDLKKQDEAVDKVIRSNAPDKKEVSATTPTVATASEAVERIPFILYKDKMTKTVNVPNQGWVRFQSQNGFYWQDGVKNTDGSWGFCKREMPAGNYRWYIPIGGILFLQGKNDGDIVRVTI